MPDGDGTVLPEACRWRTEPYPRELLGELGDLGVLGIKMPEEHGGSGGTFVSVGVAAEELSRGDFNVSYFVQLATIAAGCCRARSSRCRPSGFPRSRAVAVVRIDRARGRFRCRQPGDVGPGGRRCVGAQRGEGVDHLCRQRRRVCRVRPHRRTGGTGRVDDLRAPRRARGCSYGWSRGRRLSLV
ncbi:MAG: acyl-CoA dehydrogenase family protein [Acidimicrobiales bacterium]|nr:acyl-CoA dehydrogenase family protein [Acidimicrobiales bacterium]